MSTENETTAKTKRPKASTSYDASTDIMYITAGDGRTFQLPGADLSKPARDACFARGFSGYLLSLSKDPSEAHQKLCSPDFGKSTAAKRVDPWRQAAANVLAEEEARKAGLRALPGKKLIDDPDYQSVLNAVLKVALGWDRKQMATARGHADVVAQYAKITGGSKSLGDLVKGAVDGED